MLSFVLLLPLSLCNAQWPIQSIGYKELEAVLSNPDQPGYPNDNAPQWIENVPNLNLPKTPISEVGSLQNQELQLPDIKDRNTKTPLNDLKFPNNPDFSKDDKNVEPKIVTVKPEMKSSKFPIHSIISDVSETASFRKREFVKVTVTDWAYQEPALRNITDQLLGQLNLLYVNLAIDESDNEVTTENSYKYGMSVILRFLLEFYRIFRKLSSNQPERVASVDVYDLSYDKAIDVMKDKKNYSPLQISAPLRRTADIFKSIIYESAIIVQTKCSVMDPNWKCIIIYLANLISESKNCTNIWYHAFVHIMTLDKRGLHDHFVYKIANLDKFKELSYFENILEYLMERLQEFREEGRVQLNAEAILFTMIADLQENDLLNCFSLDSFYD